VTLPPDNKYERQLNLSLRFLGVLCVSAVVRLRSPSIDTNQQEHRRDAENAEEAQRVLRSIKRKLFDLSVSAGV